MLAYAPPDRCAGGEHANRYPPKCPKWSLPHASDRSESYDERFGQGVRSGEGRTEFLIPLCELAPVIPVQDEVAYPAVAEWLGPF